MKIAWLLLLMVSAALPVWGAEPVGKIIDLTGESWITHAQEPQPVLAFSDQDIFLGDAIKTTDQGAVKILFVDDTVLIVKESSNVLISEFLFNPKRKQRKVTFNANTGRLRTIVGRVVRMDQYVNIQTPTAVAGIRGTDIGCHVKVQSTACYCFFCEPNRVSFFNVERAERVVGLVTDQYIEVSKGMPALEKNIQPIPEAIKQKKDVLFDLPPKKAEETQTKKVKEAAQQETPTVKKEAESQTLVEKGSDESKKGSLLNETGAGTSTLENPINPGGKGSNTTTPSVTITIPKS